MDEALVFLERYGYLLLFGWVLAERIGLPLPAVPIFLAAGSLSRRGNLSLPLLIGLGSVASVASDLILYEVGRRRGRTVLSWLCRISLEPDSCVRTAEETFARHGAPSLMVAKFLPALGIATIPLAGMFGMKLVRFLFYDLIGSVLWVSSFTLLGYAFSAQLEQVAAGVSLLGTWVLAILLGGVATYIGWKYLRRRRFLSKLNVERITPEELEKKLHGGEEVVIVDLRHSVEFEAEPQTIPGALRMSIRELEERHGEIPRDREVVLYCT